MEKNSVKTAKFELSADERDFFTHFEKNVFKRQVF